MVGNDCGESGDNFDFVLQREPSREDVIRPVYSQKFVNSDKGKEQEQCDLQRGRDQPVDVRNGALKKIPLVVPILVLTVISVLEDWVRSFRELTSKQLRI